MPHLGQLARAYAALGMVAETEEVLKQLLSATDASAYTDWDGTMPLLFACQWYASFPKFMVAAQECLPRLERADRQFQTSETGAALAEARGAVALAGGHPQEAVKQLRRGVAQWKEIGRLYDQARALGNLGWALIGTGDTVSAHTAWEQGLTIFDSFAAQLDDIALKQSFLNSPRVQTVRGAYEQF